MKPLAPPRGRAGAVLDYVQIVVGSLLVAEVDRSALVAITAAQEALGEGFAPPGEEA